MYSRDPFNVRKPPPPALGYLQGAASAAAQKASETVQKAAESLQDADMSFKLPSNIPNFDNAQRRFEDHVWNKFAGNEKGLPMYKDKPASHGTRGVAAKWCHGRKRVAVVVVAVLAAFYWLGWLGSSAASEEGVDGARKEWMGSGKKGRIDWETRRESVKDAFLLSWKGYEEHGWGKSSASQLWMQTDSAANRL